VESENQLLKMKKVAHILRILMSIIFWMCIVGTIISVVFLIVNKVLPEEFFVIKEVNHLGFSLSMDGLIRYRVDEAVQKGISFKPIMVSIAIMVSTGCVGISLLVKQLEGLLRTVEKNEPFVSDNTKRLVYIGFILIIGSFLYKGAGFIVASSIINTFHITNIDLVYSVENSMTLVGFMILIVAGVFKYGSFLQKEYDSTL
jgi:hypothetical protein